MHFRFGQFELDTDQAEFRVKGAVQALEPQVFDILRHFVENPDRVISRDELIDVVWGGRIVSDATVSARISAVRKALGDSGERQASVKTVPRRGFRFTMPVERARAPDGGGSGTGAIPPLSDRPTIAVLPFDNISGDADQDYFADGMAEDLITALTRFRRLSVTARGTSFAYKGQAADPKAVGRELDVRYLLAGSVRKAGSRVRINALLIDTHSGSHLWAERFDRDLADVFDLQDEISATLAATLEPEITLAEIERARRHRADSITAWDHYLRALPHFHQLSREENQQAIAHLSRSIALDPGFVPALSLLSICHTVAATFRWTDQRQASIETAGALAQAAAAIDRTDATGNMALCWCDVCNGRVREAATAAETAVEQEPNSTMARMMLAGCYAFLSRTDDAAAMLRHGESISRRDPWRWLWYMHSGNNHFAAGRFAEAVAVLDQGVQFQPGWHGFFTIKAASAALIGQDAAARAAIRDLLALVPRMSIAGVRRYPMFTEPATIDNLIAGLQRAGLPE